MSQHDMTKTQPLPHTLNPDRAIKHLVHEPGYTVEKPTTRRVRKNAGTAKDPGAIGQSSQSDT